MDRSNFLTLPEVAQALATGNPVVALESTVITHGLPYPQNLQLASDMEAEVRLEGATPATIALLAGKVHIGLEPEELADLANRANVRKISGRDYGPAIAQGAYGGTTVAGTLIAAHTAGIRVFATGGIGGVHRQASYDISADLIEMSRTPLVVVCAGAKAILDLPATVEMLETLAIPVVGYQTDTLPAFYSTSSGLPVSARVESPQEAAALARAHWGMNLRSTVLVVQPPPPEAALPEEDVAGAIQQALDEAQANGIHGQAVTPFLLGRVSELTGGESLKANLALLRNNARLAAQIAKYI
jgi:pseudouridine-5'-phosphate glycosidase